MALQVWLPLNKDLRQQGLSTTTYTQNTGTTISSGGKLGSCLTATSNATVVVNLSSLATMLANGKTYSLACWVKITNNVANGWAIKLGTNNCGLWWAASEARWVWNENDNGKRCANPTISADTNWHHLCIVVDKTVANKIITKQYVDGALAAGYPGSTWNCSSHSQPAGTTITISPYVAQLNDIRLYDHCLSPMEVKELAKGLVLHYPLNRQGWGQNNLLKNSNFLQGTNGMQGYTATSATCTKQTDCMKVVSTSASGGFYSSNFDSIATGDMTTFSADVKANSNMTIYIGTDGFGNGSCQAYTVGTSWQRISISKAKTTNNANLRIYGNGTFYTKNLKYELGSIATPWCPNSSDTLATTMGLNSTTEYDCSGFCNNGTRVGTFTWTSDTPKYQVSSIHTGSNYIYLTPPLTEIQTIAVWVKWNTIPSGQSVILVDNGSGIGLGLMSTGILCSTSKSGNSYTFSKTSLIANTWYHFVVVKTGTTTRKLYINGVEQTATSNTSNWTYSVNQLQLGKRSTTSDGFAGKLSDFRAYATALSADDVKSLYQNSAYIDNSGNVYGTIHEV